MTDGYMHGARVKQSILQAGLTLWREGGEAKVTARAIGRAMKMTHSGCLYHWRNNVAQMKQDIAAYAVQMNDPVVVPQLITAGHPAVAHLSSEQRCAFLANVGHALNLAGA